MLLTGLFIAPGLAVCFYLFLCNMYNGKPHRSTIVSFLLGMFVSVLIIVPELYSKSFNAATVSSTVSTAFIFAALSEISKFLALRYYSFRLHSFDEPLDGIVHSMMISLGFAMLENTGYLFSDHGHNLNIALVRMLTSVSGHTGSAVVMGYFVGKAKFDAADRSTLLLKGLLYAALAHVCYEGLFLLNDATAVKQYVSANTAALLLLFGTVALLLIALWLGHKLLLLHKALLRQHNDGKTGFAIRYAAVEDVPLIIYLARRIWPVAYGKILSCRQIRYMLNRMYSRHKLTKQLVSGIQFIIVHSSGAPVGFAAYGPSGGDSYKLHKLYMLPSQQGRGSGRFTIERIINEIQLKGARSLLLNVNKFNPAKSFYEKLGFTIIRAEKIDIGNGYFMDDYIMKKGPLSPGGGN